MSNCSGFYDLPFPPEPTGLSPCGDEVPCDQCVFGDICEDSTVKGEDIL